VRLAHLVFEASACQASVWLAEAVATFGLLLVAIGGGYRGGVRGPAMRGAACESCQESTNVIRKIDPMSPSSASRWGGT